MNNGTASIERSTAPPETQQQNVRGVDGRRSSRRQEYQVNNKLASKSVSLFYILTQIFCLA